MSAVVCGSKRTYFDEIPTSPNSPPVSSKRLRCSSTSPVRFPPQFPLPVDHLRALFPLMDSQVLEKVLEECGNDVDAAIKRLQDLHLGSVEENQRSQEMHGHVETGMLSNNGVTAASQNTPGSNDLPVNGAGWVELLVSEMSAATSLDDARARAARALEMLEKSLTAAACSEAALNVQKEKQILKEQAEGLIRENSILKHAVSILHERQKESNERIRTLEINNYALSMHLERAQKNSSFPGGFNPDIF